MADRTHVALAAALLASCRPPAPPAGPTPRAPPLYVLTPERLYTDAPVGEGVSLVPVRERSIERRAGGVRITLTYPQVDLPDDDREAELTAAITGLAELERWTAETGEGRVGSIVVTCTAGLATTALVSVACESLDVSLSREEARAGGGPAPAGPTIVARVFDVAAAPIRPLTWAGLLRPGVTAAEVVARALAEEGRAAWGCAAGEPSFSLDREGLTIWPEVLADPCAPLRLDRAALLEVVVPGGLVSRALRAGEDAPLVEGAAGGAARAIALARARPGSQALRP